MSDFTPNRDRKRLSYLIVSSILSFLPWIALAQMAPSRASYVYLAVLLTTQNIGAAIVDVVVDAMVVEAARANRFTLILCEICHCSYSDQMIIGIWMHTLFFLIAL